MASKRDELRNKLLGAHKFKSKKITLVGGIDVDFRQPSVHDIMNMPQDEQGQKDLLPKMLVDYCYVPGTDEKVFEPGDIVIIKDWPVGSWINDVNNAIQELTDLQVETSVKN